MAQNTLNHASDPLQAKIRPVSLIAMPMLTADNPSFQLALLKPTLEQAGIPVELFHFYIEFGARIGWDANQVLGSVYNCQIGEWLWAKAAFGDFASEYAFMARFNSEISDICDRAGMDQSTLLRLRNIETIDFLADIVQRVDWSRYAMIGFSIVFQQMLASLALAKRIKAQYPAVTIVFGGAVFEDEIAAEILKNCPAVDVIHRGDADLTIADLVNCIAQQQPLDKVPGLMWRDKSGLKSNERAPNLADMSTTPIPDYDDYFSTLYSTGYLTKKSIPMIPFEAARGCWYGEKNHCLFCGLNRAGIQFREKPAEQVIHMLEVLSRRYGARYFYAIDNILAPSYASELFGVLAARKSDLKIHYEIRPTVNHVQLKAMHEGGLYSVQPGIESFSTHVLHLMKKHTIGMRNLELVKWATYYGINNLYNVLYGFTGETAEDYAVQAGLFPLIVHFQPPYAMAHARADRGSPMYEDAMEKGLLTPSAAYPFLYPGEFDLHQIAYYFEDNREGLPEEVYAQCRERVKLWQQTWCTKNRPSMTYIKTCHSLSISDTRFGALKQVRLDDRMADLYELCNDAKRRKDLVEHYKGEEAWLDKALFELVESKLVAFLDNRYLSLALPINPWH